MAWSLDWADALANSYLGERNAAGELIPPNIHLDLAKAKEERRQVLTKLNTPELIAVQKGPGQNSNTGWRAWNDLINMRGFMRQFANAVTFDGDWTGLTNPNQVAPRWTDANIGPFLSDPLITDNAAARAGQLGLTRYLLQQYEICNLCRWTRALENTFPMAPRIANLPDTGESIKRFFNNPAEFSSAVTSFNSTSYNTSFFYPRPAISATFDGNNYEILSSRGKMSGQRHLGEDVKDLAYSSTLNHVSEFWAQFIVNVNAGSNASYFCDDFGSPQENEYRLLYREAQNNLTFNEGSPVAVGFDNVLAANFEYNGPEPFNGGFGHGYELSNIRTIHKWDLTDGTGFTYITDPSTSGL